SRGCADLTRTSSATHAIAASRRRGAQREARSRIHARWHSIPTSVLLSRASRTGVGPAALGRSPLPARSTSSPATRAVTDDLVSTLRSIVDRLNQLRIPYMIVGSIAALAHGRSRATQDFDLVIELDRARLRALVASL